MKHAIAILMLALASPAGAFAAGRSGHVQVAGSLGQSIDREAARSARQSPGTVAPHAPQAPQQSWARRHPVALGMVVGLAGGMTVGAFQYYEGQRPFGPFIALGAGVGLGIGAGAGAIISAVRH